MSAIIPAIGAGYITLDAKLDFSGTQARSKVMSKQFAELASELDRQLENKAVVGPSQTVRDAARLALTDVDSWRHDLERRRITRGP